MRLTAHRHQIFLLTFKFSSGEMRTPRVWLSSTCDAPVRLSRCMSGSQMEKATTLTKVQGITELMVNLTLSLDVGLTLMFRKDPGAQSTSLCVVLGILGVTCNNVFIRDPSTLYIFFYYENSHQSSGRLDGLTMWSRESLLFTIITVVFFLSSKLMGLSWLVV